MPIAFGIDIALDAPPTFSLAWPLVCIHVFIFSMYYLTKASSGGTFLFVPILFNALGATVNVLLTDDCESAAAYAGSISKVSASIIKEGYVFMFVSLILVALIVLQRIGRIKRERMRREFKAGTPPDESPSSWWKALESVNFWDNCLQLTIIFVALTAVFPDAANNCSLYENPSECGGDHYPTAHYIHVVGIAGGMLFSLMSAIPRFILTVKDKLGTEDGWRYKYMGAILLSCVLMWAFNVAAFLLVDATSEPPVMHICRLYTTSSSCNGDELPPAWKARSVIEDVPQRGLKAGEWPCTWHEESELYTSYLCTDDNCKVNGRLYELQYAVVTEYAVRPTPRVLPHARCLLSLRHVPASCA